MPQKTPERLKAEKLLNWMSSHPPNLTGSDYSILAGRRKVLGFLLTRLAVTDDGCIIHGNSDSTAYPMVKWPERGGYLRCGSRGGLPGRNFPTHRLLAELYFPNLVMPAVTMPSCGRKRCVNLQHRIRSFTGTMLGRQYGWAKKLNRESAREICRLRLQGTAFDTAWIAEKFNISGSQVRRIASGRDWAKDTEDLRSEMEYAYRRVPMSAYVECCQLRLDNPDLSALNISLKTGVDQSCVGRVLRGEIYSEATKHIRSKPDFNPIPPRYRKTKEG